MFGIGDRVELISSSYEDKVQNIAERCSDLNLYDDDAFTPPESVPSIEDTEFWEWVQRLLRESARNALGILQDEG